MTKTKTRRQRANFTKRERENRPDMEDKTEERTKIKIADRKRETDIQTSDTHIQEHV